MRARRAVRFPHLTRSGTVADVATTHVFRVVWPIVDETVPFDQLLEEAGNDLAALTLQCRAVIESRGRFTIARANAVPGGGQPVSARVLVFESPARPKPSTPYTDRLLTKGDNL